MHAQKHNIALLCQYLVQALLPIHLWLSSISHLLQPILPVQTKATAVPLYCNLIRAIEEARLDTKGGLAHIRQWCTRSHLHISRYQQRETVRP